MSRYVFKSKIELSFEWDRPDTCYNYNEDDLYGHPYDKSGIADEILGAIREYGDDELAYYVDGNYQDLILEIKFFDVKEIDKTYYLFTEVLTSQPLTDDDIEYVKGFLAGQFSDGWGEGFEQQDLVRGEYETELELISDDPEEDGTYEYVELPGYIHIHTDTYPIELISSEDENIDA